MEEIITLSVDDFEKLKTDLKEEIKQELQMESNKRRWNAPIVEVGKKYHKQLLRINHGATWETIRTMAALLTGYKTSTKIPPDKMEEAAKIADELCQKVISKFEENKEGKSKV